MKTTLIIIGSAIILLLIWLSFQTNTCYLKATTSVVTEPADPNEPVTAGELMERIANSFRKPMTVETKTIQV